ncbi:MAG: signal peptidase I [Actinomycetes bacterium]
MSGTGDDSLGAGPRPGRRAARSIAEWALVVVGAVLAALLVKTFLFQAFRIPSESMVPTLQVGDRVLVNKLSYRLHDVRRGDVVVFSRPDQLEDPTGVEPEDLIKRVVAVGGDTVVARDGVLYVNNQPLTEPYVAQGAGTFRLDEPVTVPDGKVFVMGDNRENSQDSRYFGPIPTDSIVGRAFVRMFPFGRFGSL